MTKVIALATGFGRDVARNEPTPCTMVYATNPRFLATSWCASAGFASLPRLRRNQSPMRKRPARACPWVSVPRNDYVRPNPAGVSAHTEWQSLCFLFCRSHQRDDTQDHDHQRSTVAGHDPDQPDLGSWNSQRYGEHPERNLGRSRLLERRNQPCRPLVDHVGWATPRLEPWRTRSRFVLRCHGSYFPIRSTWRNRNPGPRSQGFTAGSDSSPERHLRSRAAPRDPERSLPEILHSHFRPVGAAL